MKIDMTTPEADCIMVAFNGQIVGWVIEADDEAGYIIQVDYNHDKAVADIEKKMEAHPAPKDFNGWVKHIQEPFAVPVGRVRREGKVAFIGNTEFDDPAVIRERLNKHRADCGLAPYGEA